MTLEFTFYLAIAATMACGVFLTALAIWSKKQEKRDYSFLKFVRNIRVTPSRYETIASDARILTYLYACFGAVEAARGNFSLASTFVAMNLMIHAFRAWVRSRISEA